MRDLEQTDRNLLYWLCFGLWQCRYFEPYLAGSVIPFLRLPELKSIIRQRRIEIEKKEPAFNRAVDSLNALLICEKKAFRQLELLKQVKRSLFAHILMRS